MTAPTVDPDRELAELKEYLGAEYDETKLRRWEQVVDEELAQVGGDEAALYRSSRMYLYNLTVFAMSRTKEPYLRDLTSTVTAGARLLDYGCGIGSDGLLLLEHGYDVAFADYANPSTDYLRWRLRRRGLDAPIYDLDAAPPPSGWDAVYSFDVIEHVTDPFAFLTTVEELGGLVAVNFLEPLPDERAVHHELPISALLKHVAACDLKRYRVYHGRSHLVVYKGEPGSRWFNAARIALTRTRGKITQK